jgi:hypothetical protein
MAAAHALLRCIYLAFISNGAAHLDFVNSITLQRIDDDDIATYIRSRWAQYENTMLRNDCAAVSIRLIMYRRISNVECAMENATIWRYQKIRL